MAKISCCHTITVFPLLLLKYVGEVTAGVYLKYYRGNLEM